MYVLICQTPLHTSHEIIMENKSHSSFPSALRACWIKLNTTFAKKLQKVGITPDQYSVLRWIYESMEKNQLCQKDLTELMFTDPNNIASLVKRMEKANLIYRKDDSQDKRKKILISTKLGEQKREEAKEIAENLETQTLKSFSPEEKKIFLETLGRMSAYLNA